MPNSIEILSLIASVVSALGALFAVRAAYKAGDSAREAQAALQASERRAELRELATAAGSILVEGHRANALIGQVILLHRSLAMAAGALQSSQLEMYVSQAEKKRAQVGQLVEAATPFADGAQRLAQASQEEVDRVHLQQTLALKQIQGLREDLDHEHSTVEAERISLLDQMEKARLSSRY